MTEEKFPYQKVILLATGTLTLNLTWSIFTVYVPVFLRRNFIYLWGDLRIINTLVGLIMVLDNIAALLIQPYIGALSDRTWVKGLGRRLPYIILGIPIAAFCFGLIGRYSDLLWLLLIAITGFNVSMALYKTPVMSLIPDYLPSKYRSQGSGVVSVVRGMGSILGLFVSSYLYKINHEYAFWFASIIMLICLVILIFNAREDKADFEDYEDFEDSINIRDTIKRIFSKDYRSLLLLLFAIFFNDAGYQVAETYLSSYVTVVINLTEDQAGIMLGVFSLFGMSLAVPAGIVGKKIGSLNATLIGMGGFVLTLIPLSFISIFRIDLMEKVLTLSNFDLKLSLIIYIAILIILGFSFILIAINIMVVLWDMASTKEIATYTGFYYLFSSTAAIFSPFFAGMVFDLVSFIFPFDGLRTLFLYVNLSYLAAFIFISMVRKHRLDELELEYDELTKLRDRALQKLRENIVMPFMLFGVAFRNQDVRELKKEQRETRDEISELYKNTDILEKCTDEEFKVIMRTLRKEHRREVKRLRNRLKWEIREEYTSDDKEERKNNNKKENNDKS